MPFLLQPWHIMLAALCGLVNQRQQQIIEFQNAQIDALLKQLGKNPVREYVEHYHAERNHQGLDNELIEPVDGPDSVAGRIECRERLGGMLKYYHRRAA